MGNCCGGELDDDFRPPRERNSANRKYRARTDSLIRDLRKQTNDNANLQSLVRQYQESVEATRRDYDRQIVNLQNECYNQRNINANLRKNATNSQTTAQYQQLLKTQQQYKAQIEVLKQERDKQSITQNQHLKQWQQYYQAQIKTLEQEKTGATNKLAKLQQTVNGFQGAPYQKRVEVVHNKYTHVDKLVEYTKLLESILEKWFGASTEDKKGLGRCKQHISYRPRPTYVYYLFRQFYICMYIVRCYVGCHSSGSYNSSFAPADSPIFDCGHVYSIINNQSIGLGHANYGSSQV